MDATSDTKTAKHNQQKLNEKQRKQKEKTRQMCFFPSTSLVLKFKMNYILIHYEKQQDGISENYGKCIQFKIV